MPCLGMGCSFPPECLLALLFSLVSSYLCLRAQLIWPFHLQMRKLGLRGVVNLLLQAPKPSGGRHGISKKNQHPVSTHCVQTLSLNPLWLSQIIVWEKPREGSELTNAMFGFTVDFRAARVRQGEDSPVLGSGGVMLGVPWRGGGLQVGRVVRLRVYLKGRAQSIWELDVRFEAGRNLGGFPCTSPPEGSLQR